MKDFDRSLPMMLYRTLDVVMPSFREIFSDYGLTEQQWRVLRVLWEHDSVSLMDLAAHTLISPPSLVGIVDRLSQANLVKRMPSAKDRRVVYVEATGEGAALEKEVTPRVNEIYNRMESRVDAKLWENMYQALDQIIDSHRIAAAAEKTVA